MEHVCLGRAGRAWIGATPKALLLPAAPPPSPAPAAKSVAPAVLPARGPAQFPPSTASDASPPHGRIRSSSSQWRCEQQQADDPVADFGPLPRQHQSSPFPTVYTITIAYHRYHSYQCISDQYEQVISFLSVYLG